MSLVTLASQVKHSDRRIGLVAGWGRFPVVVAEALVAQGYRVFCAGLRDHADRDALEPFCVDFRPSGLARMGGVVRYFRRSGIRNAVMAGKVHKTKLTASFTTLRLLPDLWTLRVFFHSFVLSSVDRRDDTILGTVVRAAAEEGVVFAPATDFAPELLVKHGQLTKRRPTAGEQQDIALGWSLAKELGRLDIGQSVAVKNRTPLAVEAIEGTDACIHRAGKLCTAGGFTVVKVAKPQQDMRFDVPTIGVGTIQQMLAAGATCLAVEAGMTIFIDQSEVVRLADANKLAIVAVSNAAEAVEPVMRVA